MKNTMVVLAARPDGTPKPSDFKFVEGELPELGEGQVRLKVEHLSIDAFIRTMLDGDEGAHHGTIGLEETPVIALGTARVVESRFDGLNQGDAVFGPLGAQSYATMPGEMYRKLEEDDIAPQTYLGALGMTTGLTAYTGMINVGEVKADDVVVVSAAAGAVGSMACQIAKVKATVIGIAGGPAKCDYLTQDVGCDFAIDYKNDDIDAKLKEFAPEGVDLFFDNVGGELLDTVLDNLAMWGRVILCGAISQYNDRANVRGPALYLRIAERNASMRGFTVDKYAEHFGQMEADIKQWMNEGKVNLHEQVESGIESFPDALIMLFTGGHKGKLLVAP